MDTNNNSNNNKRTFYVWVFRIVLGECVILILNILCWKMISGDNYAFILEARQFLADIDLLRLGRCKIMLVVSVVKKND